MRLVRIERVVIETKGHNVGRVTVLVQSLQKPLALDDLVRNEVVAFDNFSPTLRVAVFLPVGRAGRLPNS